MIKQTRKKKAASPVLFVFAHPQKTKTKIKKETRDRRQTHRASAHSIGVQRYDSTTTANVLRP
ncbi:MAG: hypothetical protein QM535_21875, partial [Limnohabitans sp.]|nr:hypothetical protein [Limnohabitans sp.]